MRMPPIYRALDLIQENTSHHTSSSIKGRRRSLTSKGRREDKDRRKRRAILG